MLSFDLCPVLRHVCRGEGVDKLEARVREPLNNTLANDRQKLTVNEGALPV